MTKINLEGDEQVETVRKAVVENGFVTNVIVVAKGDKSFTIPGAEIIEIGDSVCAIGDEYKPETISRFARPKPKISELLDFLTNCRKNFEKNGIEFKGKLFPADKESQISLLGVHMYSVENPNAKIQFKTLGGFVEMDVTGVKNLTASINKHIQAGFTIEASATEQIKNGKMTTFEEINNLFNRKAK